MRLATVRRSHLFSPQINGHMARRVISQKDVARLAMVIVSGKWTQLWTQLWTLLWTQSDEQRFVTQTDQNSHIVTAKTLDDGYILMNDMLYNKMMLIQAQLVWCLMDTDLPSFKVRYQGVFSIYSKDTLNSSGRALPSNAEFTVWRKVAKAESTWQETMGELKAASRSLYL